MKRESSDQRIALFIDFENLVTRTGIPSESFDLQPALDTLLEKGKVVFRRAYADWTRFAAATQRLHDKGVELVDVPPSTRAGKNGADVRLEADMSHAGMAPVFADAAARGDGVYEIPFSFTMRGDWVLLISVALPDGARLERRIDVANVRPSG